MAAKAFYGGRSYMSNAIDNAIDSSGGDLPALKTANKDYGMASKVAGSTQADMARTDKNQFFGLKDSIYAAPGIAGAMYTHDPKVALLGAAGLGAKKAIDKYGLSTASYGADKVGNLMSQFPQLQDLSQTNPELANILTQRYLNMKEGQK